MTPILGALVLAAVVSLVFFTRAGRDWYEERADALDDAIVRWKGPDHGMRPEALTHRITYPANPVKAQRTWRRAMRVYIATRKGEL